MACFVNKDEIVDKIAGVVKSKSRAAIDKIVQDAILSKSTTMEVVSETLGKYKVGGMKGIGPTTAKRLEDVGIKTAEDLMNADAVTLQKAMDNGVSKTTLTRLTDNLSEIKTLAENSAYKDKINNLLLEITDTNKKIAAELLQPNPDMDLIAELRKPMDGYRSGDVIVTGYKQAVQDLLKTPEAQDWIKTLSQADADDLVNSLRAEINTQIASDVQAIYKPEIISQAAVDDMLTSDYLSPQTRAELIANRNQTWLNKAKTEEAYIHGYNYPGLTEKTAKEQWKKIVADTGREDTAKEVFARKQLADILDIKAKTPIFSKADEATFNTVTNTIVTDKNAEAVFRTTADLLKRADSNGLRAIFDTFRPVKAAGLDEPTTRAISQRVIGLAKSHKLQALVVLLVMMYSQRQNLVKDAFLYGINPIFTNDYTKAISTAMDNIIINKDPLKVGDNLITRGDLQHIDNAVKAYKDRVAIGQWWANLFGMGSWMDTETSYNLKECNDLTKRAALIQELENRGIIYEDKDKKLVLRQGKELNDYMRDHPRQLMDLPADDALRITQEIWGKGTKNIPGLGNVKATDAVLYKMYKDGTITSQDILKAGLSDTAKEWDKNPGLGGKVLGYAEEVMKATQTAIGTPTTTGAANRFNDPDKLPQDVQNDATGGKIKVGGIATGLAGVKANITAGFDLVKNPDGTYGWIAHAAPAGTAGAVSGAAAPAPSGGETPEMISPATVLGQKSATLENIMKQGFGPGYKESYADAAQIKQDFNTPEGFNFIGYMKQKGVSLDVLMSDSNYNLETKLALGNYIKKYGINEIAKDTGKDPVTLLSLVEDTQKNDVATAIIESKPGDETWDAIPYNYKETYIENAIHDGKNLDQIAEATGEKKNKVLESAKDPTSLVQQDVLLHPENAKTYSANSKYITAVNTAVEQILDNNVGKDVGSSLQQTSIQTGLNPDDIYKYASSDKAKSAIYTYLSDPKNAYAAGLTITSNDFGLSWDVYGKSATLALTDGKGNIYDPTTGKWLQGRKDIDKYSYYTPNTADYIAYAKTELAAGRTADAQTFFANNAHMLCVGSSCPGASESTSGPTGGGGSVSGSGSGGKSAAATAAAIQTQTGILIDASGIKAAVKENDVTLGTTDVPIYITAGQHTFVVSKYGYETYSFSRNITSGKILNVTISLYTAQPDVCMMATALGGISKIGPDHLAKYFCLYKFARSKYQGWKDMADGITPTPEITDTMLPTKAINSDDVRLMYYWVTGNFTAALALINNKTACKSSGGVI